MKREGPFHGGGEVGRVDQRRGKTVRRFAGEADDLHVGDVLAQGFLERCGNVVADGSALGLRDAAELVEEVRGDAGVEASGFLGRWHGCRVRLSAVQNKYLEWRRYGDHGPVSVAISMRAGLLDSEGAAAEIDLTERQLHEIIEKLRAFAGIET